MQNQLQKRIEKMLKLESGQKNIDESDRKLAIDRARNAGNAFAAYLRDLKTVERYNQDKPEVSETKAAMLRQFISYHREIKTSEIGYRINCPVADLLKDVEENAAEWFDEKRIQERENHVGFMLWQRVFPKLLKKYLQKYSLDVPYIGVDEPKHISKFFELLKQKRCDIAVGIAREALSYSCLFEQLGGNVINLLIKEEKDREYSPLDDLGAIKNKRVLVLEDDIVTGKTIEKVHGILSENKPRSLELYIGNMLSYKFMEDAAIKIRCLLPDQIATLGKLFKKTYLPLEEKSNPSFLRQGLGYLLRDYIKK